MLVIKTNIEYGKKYTDKNTGFTGVAVCVSAWEFGCLRITLQPSIDKDGKLPDQVSFDEESLVGVEAILEAPGGPRPEPQRK